MQPLPRRFTLIFIAAFATFGSTIYAQTPTPTVEKTYNISFTETPWPEVFKWFEREVGLTYIKTEVKPKGTLTARSDRKYTLPQVIDLFNEALAPQKLHIYRRSQIYLVMGIDERNPDMKPRIVTIDDLSNWGDTEVVMVLLPLTTVVAEDVMPQIKKLLSSYCTASAFGSDQIIILDKAKNIRNILHYIKTSPPDDRDQLIHGCKYVLASVVAEQLMLLFAYAGTKITNNTNTTTSPWDSYGGGWGQQHSAPRDTQAPQERRFRSVQISVDTETNTVRMTGTADRIVAAREFLKGFDKPTLRVVEACPLQCVLRAEPCPLRTIFRGRCR